MLALAQSPDRVVVPRVNDKVEPAEPLDREDVSVANELRGLYQSLVTHRQCTAAGIPERELGPALGASVRLRVEPAIRGIFVLGAARGTHRERLHGRVRPVVRQALDDAEARAAVRAVCEGVAIASIVRAEQLAQAIGTRCDVREDYHALLAGFFTVADLKGVVPDWVEKGGFEALD